MKLRVAAKTDPGRLSDHNEDYVLARDDLHVYAVADGVGGLDAGEVASAAACRFIGRALAATAPTTDRTRHDDVLADAIRQGNQGLFDLGAERGDTRGIGTTISAIWFHGDRTLFAYVGDSRLYLYRQGRLRQLSRDEKVGQFRLAASLGQERTVDVHMGMVRLRTGDRFLLCTDGLYGPVDGQSLAAILEAEADPVRCCTRLVAKANACGGPDNITALVADVIEADPPAAWHFHRVRRDATSALPRLWQPRLFASVVAGVLLVVLLWSVGSLAFRSGRSSAPTCGPRIAALRQEANAKARAGDRGAALALLTDLVTHAVHTRQLMPRAELELDPAADALFEAAANAAWDRVYGRAGRKLEALEKGPARRFIGPEVRAARERADHAHDQFRKGDYTEVARTFEELERQVADMARRGAADLAREKQRLSEALARLRNREAAFAADNPLRRKLTPVLDAAAKAIDAAQLVRARKHIRAAEAILRTGAAP